jgi:hypothetical protein
MNTDADVLDARNSNPKSKIGNPKSSIRVHQRKSVAASLPSAAAELI